MIPIPLERPNLPRGASVDGVPMATTAGLLALRREIDKFTVNSVNLRLFGVSVEEPTVSGGTGARSRVAATEHRVRLDESAISQMAQQDGLLMVPDGDYKFLDGADASGKTSILESWLTMGPSVMATGWRNQASINLDVVLKVKHSQATTLTPTGFNCRDGWNLTTRHLIESWKPLTNEFRNVLIETQANVKIKDGKRLMVVNASYAVWAESDAVSEFADENGLWFPYPMLIKSIVGEWPTAYYGYSAGGAGDPGFTGGGPLDLAAAGGFKHLWTNQPKLKTATSEPGAKMAGILRLALCPDLSFNYAVGYLERPSNDTPAQKSFKGVSPKQVPVRVPTLSLSILSVR